MVPQRASVPSGAWAPKAGLLAGYYFNMNAQIITNTGMVRGRAVPYHLIRMAIEMASKVGAFVSAIDFMSCINVVKRPC